jgi:hypothetical protein
MEWLEFLLQEYCNYHKAINHHLSFWELTIYEHDKFHLPEQFYKKIL